MKSVASESFTKTKNRKEGGREDLCQPVFFLHLLRWPNQQKLAVNLICVWLQFYVPILPKYFWPEISLTDAADAKAIGTGSTRGTTTR